MTLKTTLIALSGSTLNPRLDPARFWHHQESKISKGWTKDPVYFNRLFGESRESFNPSRLKSNDRHSFMFPVIFWVDRHLRWLGRSPSPSLSGTGSSGDFPSFVPRPLGVMAVLGMVFGVACSRRNLQCLALFLPLAIYMFGTFAIGDAVTRYLQPVEWIGFVFVGVFLDRLIALSCYIFSIIESK